MMILTRSLRTTLGLAKAVQGTVCWPSSSLVNNTLHTTTSLSHLLDARDQDIEKKEKQLTLMKGRMFDEAAQEVKNEKTFRYALNKYKSRVDKYGRGNVEFIYAAMNRMKEFNVHRNLSLYKEILSILPKDKMVPQTVWQVEMMHYPKQQQCCIDLMDFMELQGVCPDDEFGYILKDRFGVHAHAFRKYRRMMYWMPKFKHANPYPVPYELPEDPRELARLALQRMCPDPLNIILDFDTNTLESEEVMDETFVVSAQSPDQTELLTNHNPSNAVFVEGGFTVWLRSKSLTYFILRSETTDAFRVYKENSAKEVNQEEYYKDFLQDIPFFGNTKAKPSNVIKVPSIHEQDDGTILAMCITGTGSKNSLVSWIKWLQDRNPVLAKVPVIFTLKTPETGLQVVKGEDDRRAELAEC